MRLRAAALIAGFAALALAAPARADTFTVTDGSSDSTAACSGTTCPSLRAAIAAAVITRPADVINVPAGTININNDMLVGSDVTIVGTSARTNIIDGGAKYRGLRVGAGASVTFSHFTIRNGAAGQGGSNDGGGVLNQGTTVLDSVHITKSRATNGGGVANAAGASLSIQHSLIDQNVATGDGGGVYNLGSVETTPITLVSIGDSTIFDNTAQTLHGGISNQNNGGFLIVGRSTISDNTGGKGAVGGVFLEVAGRGQLYGTIVARNRNDTTTVNCGATSPTDGGANVEDNDTCAFNFTGNPGLDTKLSSAGGEVDVLALAAASPAVDRLATGDNCTAGTLDQRGLYRPQGSACDSGAYEFDQDATYTITGGPSGTISSDSAQLDFSSSDPSATPECQLTGPGQTGGYAACYKSNAALYTNLANGTFTFSVRDSAFPSSTPATRTFTVAALDTTITGGPSGPTNDTTPTFTFTGVNGAVSFQCRVDGATFATCASPFTTAALGQGAHTFEVRALSASGAPENTPASRSFTVDSVAPDTTITGGPSGTVASTSAAFTFTSTETGSTFQCALDGAGFAACPASYTGLAQGSHTFQVRAVDAATNPDPSPASRTWTVDTVAPDTTITGGPTGNVASTSATFTFTATEAGSTFQCALDGAGFAACPASYTGLAQGAHTFQVRATDAVGNTDATPASRTWTVDTVAPDTTITGGPSGTVASTTATFTFSSTEAGSTFQCQFDGAGFGSCPASYTGLGQGSHTFQVRAVDAAGNVDPTPASQTFTVDTVAPNTNLTPVSSPGNDNTPTFTFTSTEAGSTFQCRLDGAAFATCTSPLTTAALADGAHTFDVRAVDAAGNVDATPASQTFTVDTTAPNTTLTPIATPTNDNTPTFTFSSDAGATFQCRVDGAAFAACTSPLTTAALTDAPHTFDVRAVDSAGNVDPTPATQTFSVDTTAPNTTLTPIASPTNDTTPTFAFSSEAGATFACRVDGAAFAACTSPFTTDALLQGSHTVEVRATDAAGNVDPTPASQTFTVDTTAPNTTLTPISSPTNDTTPTFSFTSEAGASFQCRVDGAVFAACTSPLTTAALADGTHAFDVRAIDAAGNVDATPASQTFTIDTTAPNTTITAGADNPGNDSTPTFTFTATEPGSTFQCRVDGAAFATCASPFTTAVLNDGSHTFDVRATDAAGNTDATPATQTFVVDTTTPNTDITGGPTATNDTTPTFTFSGSAGASAFQCRVDAAAFAACSSPFTTAVLSVGTHTFEVRALNAAGTPDPSPASRAFVVDLTAPNTTLTPISTPTNDTTPTFSFSSDEAGSTFECRVDTTAFAACTSAFTTAALTQGPHTFEVRATDPAGNVDATPATQAFVVDTAPPDTTLTPTGSPTNDTTPTFAFSSEAGAVFECRVDNAAFAPCSSPFTTSALGQGGHTFEVRAIDTAGNVDATPATQTFVIDTTAPNTTLTPIASPTNHNTPAFTFTSEAGATFQCRVDGGAYGSCASPFTTAVLTDGSHTFDVRAIDTAGNVDATPGTQTFTVDTAAPNTTLNPITTPTRNSAPTFTFSSEAGATFQCRVDGATFAACTSPHTTAALADGSHTFDVRAVDAAGNADATPGTQAFVIDTAAPDTTITSGPSGPTNDDTPAFTFTSEAGATFECSLDGAPFTACPAAYTTPRLGAGAHTLDVRAVDAVGNPDATPASRAFTVDTTAPDTELTPIASPSNDNTPTFAFSSEAGASFQCRVDGSAYGSCASPFTTAVLTDGSHTFDVRAIDVAGNVDATPASQTFQIDTGVPVTTIDGGPSGATNDPTPTFTFSSEAGATFRCRIDGAPFATCASPFTTAALADGPHTFEVQATDVNGNAEPTPASRTFTVDTAPPPAPEVVSGPAGPTTNSSPQFDFAAADAASTACRLDGPAGAVGEFGACASPKAFNGLVPGDYVFLVRSTDAAGNTRITQRAFTVTAPQQATPTPTPTATPTPSPTPVPNQSVGGKPVTGTVLVKQPGSKTFVPLSPSLIRNGAEVDARKGTVEITRSDGGVAKFYDGIFKLSHSGGYTVLTLTEKLTGCPKAKKSSASIAAKKPKSRKLWGNGKGKFRTKGQYSAATVRGTIWLVQDTCTTTLTRVKQGVVEVQDLVKKKKLLVKAPKSYTARAKKK
jgi:hypothetical protein